MRFYRYAHRHTSGIDLHARSMYHGVLDEHDQVVLHKNFPASPVVLLDALAPFREDLAIGVECMFGWYWMADLCARDGIPFVLGHALSMGAIHGSKSKSDRIDELKIAKLLKGGMFPMAYVYPRAMRATRDLLRCWLTSRTPTTSTTSPPRAASSTRAIAKGSASASTIRAPRRRSSSTSPWLTCATSACARCPASAGSWR